MKHWRFAGAITIAGLFSALIIAGCAALPSPPPPPIAVTPPPKPTIVVQQVCLQPDVWAPGEEAAASEALAPIVKANPAAKHLLMEWYRLRADAKACIEAQK